MSKQLIGLFELTLDILRMVNKQATHTNTLDMDKDMHVCCMCVAFSCFYHRYRNDILAIVSVANAF